MIYGHILYVWHNSTACNVRMFIVGELGQKPFRWENIMWAVMCQLFFKALEMGNRITSYLITALLK